MPGRSGYVMSAFAGSVYEDTLEGFFINFDCILRLQGFYIKSVFLYI